MPTLPNLASRLDCHVSNVALPRLNDGALKRGGVVSGDAANLALCLGNGLRMSDAKPTFRIEHDTFGDIEVASDKLWGAQTQRALHHFAISSERMPPELIWALALVKRAAALVNSELGVIDPAHAAAIAAAAGEVLAGEHADQFPLSLWQSGSGTQTNMNVNEVLANRASELLGYQRGVDRAVHPNDEVNRGQSTNDVFPTAINVAVAKALSERLLPALDALRTTLSHRKPKNSSTSSRSAARTCRTQHRSPLARNFQATRRSSNLRTALSDMVSRACCRLPLAGRR